MNFLKIILSIYIIMLTVYPCTDKHTDISSKISHRQMNHQHHHSQDDKGDLCSPFCVCNCCGQQILNFCQETTFEFRKKIKEINTQIPTYKSKLVSNFYGSIWQPPQIV